MVENIKNPVSRFATFAQGEGDGVESYCLVFGVRPVRAEGKPPSLNCGRDPRSGMAGLVAGALP